MEINLKCRNCGRWLGKTDSNTDNLTIKCGNCKTNNIYNVTFTSTLKDGLWYSKSRTDLSEQPAKANTEAAEQRRAERSEVSNE